MFLEAWILDAWSTVVLSHLSRIYTTMLESLQRLWNREQRSLPAPEFPRTVYSYDLSQF